MAWTVNCFFERGKVEMVVVVMVSWTNQPQPKPHFEQSTAHDQPYINVLHDDLLGPCVARHSQPRDSRAASVECELCGCREERYVRTYMK